MRTFLALALGDHTVESLSEEASMLAEINGVKSVDPENYHLTIKFLGECGDLEREELGRLFQRRLVTPGPILLNVSGAGAFPDLSSPSILWAGIESTSSLIKLFDSVEELAEEQGFEPETHNFHPHVTMARVKEQSEKNQQHAVEWVQQFDPSQIPSTVSEHLICYESELTPEGPIYHEWERWPL